MSDTKEDSAMGLPRASGGKRRWTGDEGPSDLESPAKAVCTSPPYGHCAEDVLPTQPIASPTSNAQPATIPSPPSSSGTSEEIKVFTDSECEITLLAASPPTSPPAPYDADDTLSDMPVDDYDEDEENFIDDEEDKDSGFIDGNSIDNSSDEDCDVKGVTVMMSKIETVVATTTTTNSTTETDLQISLARVLPQPSSQLSTAVSSLDYTVSSPTSVVSSPIPSVSIPIPNTLPSLVTTTYDNTSYSSTQYTTSPDQFPTQTTTTIISPQNRSCTPPCTATCSTAPSWSCTFYDGSQPTTTNKYMEISPTRSSSTNQSIQCDENGKSYLELGSAAPPYPPNTYGPSQECGTNFTTPSTYNAGTPGTPGTPPTTFSHQNFSGSGSPPPYASGNSYFCNRAAYGPHAPPYGYPQGGPDSGSYSGYEGPEGGCTYNYIGGYGPPNVGRGHHHGSVVPQRSLQPHLQRCSSPLCDPTRTAPRPSCYPQQRLSVLNLSMFKLNRFSRYPEPSLHRSVLICNTLRHIEREMEAEGVSMTAILAHCHAYGGPPPPPPGGHSPETMPSIASTPPLASGEGGPLPSIHSPLIGSPLQPPITPPPSVYSNDSLPTYSSSPYPHDPCRDSPMPFEAAHPRDTLPPLRSFPNSPPLSMGERQSQLLSQTESPAHSLTPEDGEIMEGATSPGPRLCEDRTEGINWCSVLSLSSQPDLDSMNNNECHEWNNEDGGEHPQSPSPPTLTQLTPSRSLVSPIHEGSPSTSNGNSCTVNATPVQYSAPSSSSVENVSGELGHTGDSTRSWKLPSLSADDVLKSFPDVPRRQEEDLDSIIKVLVGS